ncbi:unnamed protein product [Adineta steineri]|uniref:F-box domain-containing protein n=1 Tax=Adineta steineri TaxID=433720 RepID=A0A819XYX1_9BILA|nr:unnamed protein product [Adineta steineri]CAF4150713.1 unnamed protein product [Adineta steineri]
MHRACFFDLLPVQLLHTLFSYFLAYEILLTFSGINDYVNSVLLAYTAYRVNFESIRRTNFDLICHRIRPEQIILLKLSDNRDTPGLSEVFFSRFQIEQFTQLRSITLNEIEFESMESIFSNLHKLNKLRSFSFNADLIRRKYPPRTSQYSNISNKINLRLLNAYSRILPRLTHLYLHSGDVLQSIPLSHLYYLKLDKCTLDELEIIIRNAPQLQSLNICLELDTSKSDISLISSHLTQLNLTINNCGISMDEMERFLPNLPYLKHVKLSLKGLNDLGDGYRWQMLTSSFMTFSFKFKIELTSINETFRSFQTPFWLEEKRWFVAYQNECLYSIHHSHVNVMNGFPQASIFSTAPDVIVERNPIHKLKKTQHLYINSYDGRLRFRPSDYKLADIREIGITSETIDIFRQIKDYQFKQIYKLDIYIRNKTKNPKDMIKQLLRLFPCVEHLTIRAFEGLTIEHMLFIIEKFKHLQNLSFLDTCSLSTEIVIYYNQKLISQITWRLTDDNFTCRIFKSPGYDRSSGIHWWIGPEPSVSHAITYYQMEAFYYSIAVKIILDFFFSTTTKCLWKRTKYIFSQFEAFISPLVNLHFGVYTIISAIWFLPGSVLRNIMLTFIFQHKLFDNVFGILLFDFTLFYFDNSSPYYLYLALIHQKVF